jgi:peptide/nickel transport system substrate-binding protein
MKRVVVGGIVLLGLMLLIRPVLQESDSSAIDSAAAFTGSDIPQYGGELNIGTVYTSLSPLSWDPADWSWKLNHDTGNVREQLLAADMDMSIRKGGPYAFRAEAYLPEEAWRGELAESWEWEDELTLVMQLRRGVMFPDKPGVMKARELTADDVLFTFEYINSSPKRIASYFDHIERLEVRSSHTVVFHFSEYNAEWAYRFGYGYYSGIVPREIADVDAKDWRNMVGSGPFQLERYVQGNSQTYSKNTEYWDTETLDGEPYKIPFVDSVTYRIIKDEATWLTALRTGKLDILESVRWIAVDHLKETTPELQWSRWLGMGGNFLVMRLDREPFDDVRVRRALNLAINQPEIVELFYGGHAELMAYPQHPGFGDYYQTLEEMPQSVQELFTYNPEKARRLLAEAGFPDGFEFNVQVCACNPQHMDLIPLLDGYLAEIGVRLNIQPLEYASFLSMMTTRNHESGYLMSSGHTNPTTTLRKSFQTGQTWNPSQFSDPDIDDRIALMLRQRDETERVRIARQITIDMLDRAPYIWLPTGYGYTAWWPWVKNYNGELRAGAVRPGPIYARLWIDQEMKRSMGFDR